ncbi:PIR protein [Plasmodium vivax]|nr:PIR protein [Plasmodium vivax]CAI7724159.1 PIR protein [Plasmodium vivax]
MSEKITDIENWKEEYHFLEHVWTTYNDFDKNVEDHKSSYDFLCDIILKESSVELSKYKDFCMKLMRNLGYFSVKRKFYAPSQERCNILYNWIYNSIEKNKTTDNVVNKCFKEYTDNMMNVTNAQKCSKLAHEGNFVEPIKITLLDIFDHNTPTIINALINVNYSISTPGLQFVCECVRIYKYMYDSYCLNYQERKGKKESTCLKLDQFKKSYEYFLLRLQGSNHNIPLLSDGDKELLAKCSPDKLNLPLNPVESQNTDLPSEDGIFANPRHTGSTLEDGLSTPLESTDNSMKKNITTTIGTVAGASSLLALLYRFTPAKGMIFSGFRGSRGRVHSNMYEDGHNELLNDHELENFSSYKEGYNIGYGSV